MLDGFDSANSGNIGNEELPNLNLGTYTDSLEVQKIKLFNGTKPGATHKKYFKCVFKMLKSENGHQAGELVQQFETVSGSGFPHFDGQAIARVKKLLGAIAGLKTDAEITAQVKGSDLQLAQSDAQPFKGRVVSAVVTGKNPKFPNVVCLPASGVTASSAPSVPKPDALEKLPHPNAPGYFYDASGAVFDGTGKRVN